MVKAQSCRYHRQTVHTGITMARRRMPQYLLVLVLGLHHAIRAKSNGNAQGQEPASTVASYGRAMVNTGVNSLTVIPAGLSFYHVC